MSTQTPVRPRRSCLYMPGANARALEKARSLPADVLILDLEDSVAPDAKAEAREAVALAVSGGGYGSREVLIRTNGLGTEWGREDLAAAASAGADGILVPKVTTAEDIISIDAALDDCGAAATLGLWVMIEMPLAVLNIREIAAAAQTTRLMAFVVGANDLGKELRGEATPDRSAFQFALSATMYAARAHGLVAIDGVFNDIGDSDGLRDECEQGRVLGFDGKSLIHPAQLETANRVFSPNPEDVALAREIIEAFDQPENRDKGVIKVAGKMTERLHLEQAVQLVAINDSIAALENA